MKMLSNKNICRLILLVGCLCFISWYFPVAYANVYACDDYWFGTNVNNYGFWGNQVYYWLYWEGSFTHTFLDSLPHLFEYDRMPFLFNVFSLSALVFAVYEVTISFFHISRLDAWIFSLYICTILYTFTTGGSEIRFWVSANSYVIELAVVLLVISLYHKKNKVSTQSAWYVGMGILLFVVAGSKLTFILYLFMGIILHDILLKDKPNKQTYFVIGILFMFSLINVLAPGNLIRLNEETSVYHEDTLLFCEILYMRLLKILPSIVYSILLFPISLFLKTKRGISISQVVYSIIFLLIAFLFDGIIMFICFRDPGPSRVYVVCEMMVLVLSLCLFANISRYVCNNLNIRCILCSITTAILVICNIPMISKKQPSIDFACESRLRNQKIKDAGFNGCVEISPLPESHLLLSYFANDIEWIKNVYAPYFNTNCEIKLVPFEGE